MLKKLICGMFLLAVTALFAAIPEMAFAAEIAEVNPGSTVIDFGKVAQSGDGYLYALLALAAGAIYGWLSKYPLFNKLVSKEQYQKLVDPLLDEAVAFGVGKLSNADWLKIDTKNEAVAYAANYALAHGGDLLKKFGVSEDKLKEKLEAKLVANGWDTKPGKWDAPAQE